MHATMMPKAAAIPSALHCTQRAARVTLTESRPYKRRSLLTAPRPFRIRCSARLGVTAADFKTAGLVFRQATDADLPAISKAVLREAMNPLSLKPERFVVAAHEADGAVQGFGQLAPLGGAPQGGPPWLELRSLIVDPDHRGGGIGHRLLAELVRRAADADLFLTTLDSMTRFYSPQGFRTLQPSDIPRSLLFEYWAGTVIARIAANDKLVVMRRPAGES